MNDLPGLHYEEFELNQVFVTPRRTVTETDVVMFAGLSGDYNPLHTDEVFAETTPFKARIAHGLLSLSVLTGLIGKVGMLEGTTLAFLGLEWDFKGPVLFGDTIYGRLEVAFKRETSRPERGIVHFDCQILNQRDDVVQQGVLKMMVRRKAN